MIGRAVAFWLAFHGLAQAQTPGKHDMPDQIIGCPDDACRASIICAQHFSDHWKNTPLQRPYVTEDFDPGYDICVEIQALYAKQREAEYAQERREEQARLDARRHTEDATLIPFLHGVVKALRLPLTPQRLP